MSGTGGPAGSIRVCVIGAGLSGLAAARELIGEPGIAEVVVFEEQPDLGGLWNGKDGRAWSGLRLNTSRWLSELSNSPIAAARGDSFYPTFDEYGSYLRTVAKQDGVLDKVRFSHRVVQVRRQGAELQVVYETSRDGTRQEERFDRLVVATGFFSKPNKFELEGLDLFRGNVVPSNAIRGVDVRGKRVAVIGSGITACELAVHAVARGATALFSCSRCPPIVLPRAIDGVPADAVGNVRASVMLSSVLPETVLAALNGLIVKKVLADGPKVERAVSTDIRSHGICLSNTFLSLIASGKIVETELPVRADQTSLHFAGGRAEEVDIVFDCTGYVPSYEYLDEALQREVVDQGAPPYHLNLYKRTFHPSEPAIAFVGQYRSAGSVLPVAEMQGRWLAAVFSGRTALPPENQVREEMARSTEYHRSDLKNHRSKLMGEMLEELADQVGCKPQFLRDPSLYLKLLGHPVYPVMYRIHGPNPDPTAYARLQSYLDGEKTWLVADDGYEDKLSLYDTL